MSASVTPQLATVGNTLPAARDLETLAKVQEFLLRETPQVPIRTEHVIHGGMYARTVRLQPGTLICGCLYKVPTTVIVSGTARIYVGDCWADVSGCQNVIPASAGRKQLFLAITQVEITMMFPTSAKTVEQAENEMTDEAEQLVSRGDNNDLITITGE